MAQIETWLKCDLKKPVKVQYLHGNLFSQDNQANLIGVELYDNGTAVTASGTVTANIIREDGATVIATGSVSGNKASVVLPAAAYAIPGAIAIIIKITLSGVITTIAAVVGTVYRSSTDTSVDPGTIMPSIQTLISQIQTAVASIPADYSSLWTSLAPAFSASTNYDAGQHVTNNGKVYRFNVDHTAGAWVASEVTEVKLGDEISELKSAFDEFEGRIEKTNVILDVQSVTIAGTGAYVYEEMIRTDASAGEKFTGAFADQTGATSNNYIFIRFYDSNGTQLSQSSSGTNKSLTAQAPASTAKVAFVLYPAQGTAMPTGSATFTGVKFAKGDSIVYEINPSVKYQRMDDAEDSIERIETNFNDVLCYNLMGNDSSVYYPVTLNPGDKVTFSNKDGSVFPSASTLVCALCDENKSTKVNKSLNTNTTATTYTIPAGIYIRYLKWNETPGDVMVNYGASVRPYIVYNSETIGNEVKRIACELSANSSQLVLANKVNGILKLGTMKNGDIPFTKDEASPGDIVHYHFISPTGATVGQLRMRDSSDNALSFYVKESDSAVTHYYSGVGRDAAVRPEEYSGYLIVPENFDHCIVACNASYTLTIKELYINRNEDRIATQAMDIPEYYFIGNYLPAKATSINERLESTLANGDAFIFITDLHLKANQKHSPALIRYLYQHTCINKLVYGGDLMDGGQSNEYPITRQYMNEMREAFPRIQLFTVGNHDTFQNNPSSRITTWSDALMDNFNGNSENHYFYYDNQRSKIRYIVLNRYYEGAQNISTGFYVDTVQSEWFVNTALDLDTGWGAVIFIHNLYNFNYTEENPVMAIDVGCKAALADVCDAYNANPESKGEVIAIVQGHTHSDRVLRTTGGIPIIITTCDKNAQADPEQPDILFPDGVEDRASETIREQAFDVIVINRKKNANNKGTIYAIRVGCEAYDGEAVDDMGSATQERVILYDEKF